VKKFLTTVIVLAIVVVGVGWYAKNMLVNKVSAKVVSLLNSPELKQRINEALNNPEVQYLIHKYASQDTGGLTFQSQQDAIEYAINHMSPSEDMKLLQAYNHRDSLTPEQEKELAQEVLSQFSPQQLAAIAKTFDTGTNP
jgi:hypothetical protein